MGHTLADRTSSPTDSGRPGGAAVAGMLLAAMLLPALNGCTLLGAAAYKASGDPTVEAKYVLPKEPAVVVVQRSQNPAEAALDADRIARHVTADLKAHGVTGLLDPSAVPALRPNRGGGSVWAARVDGVTPLPSGPGADPTGPTPPPAGPQAVAALARAAGARQVVYVDLTKFHIDPAMATEMIKGQAEALVWVLDADTGQSRWPADSSQGHAVTVGTPYVEPGEKVDEVRLRERMSRDLAEHVARLFYKWTATQTDAITPLR